MGNTVRLSIHVNAEPRRFFKVTERGVDYYTCAPNSTAAMLAVCIAEHELGASWFETLTALEISADDAAKLLVANPDCSSADVPLSELTTGEVSCLEWK